MMIGFIGLGKMGRSMVMSLLREGVDVVAFNRTGAVTQALAQEATTTRGAGKLTPVFDVASVITTIPAPRTIWLMVAAGHPVDESIRQLIDAGLTRGDTIIDGGNSFYKDSLRRYEELKQRAIAFIDCGTSGGLEGARHGACLMIGGDNVSVEGLAWLWDRLSAPPAGSAWKHVGPPGAGHFVKMVHNAIEYGMNQAIGEGCELLSKSPYELDLAGIVNLWNHRSIIHGYLIELLGRELREDHDLSSFTGSIGGGQTGAWALETAKALSVQVGVLAEALAVRKRSQTNPSFATKVVSALRHAYGGHQEGKGT